MKGLFLDRDGVINIDYGYVYKKEKFVFIDGIFNLVKQAKLKDYKIVIITNQSGIGRGYYSERDFLLLTKWMKEVFIKNDAPIDKVYYSPYHPIFGIGKYKKNEKTRKPNPGLILKAQKRLNISLKHSILIGDKLSDIQAGKNSGIKKNILFKNKRSFISKNKDFFEIGNLIDALKFLD